MISKVIHKLEMRSILTITTSQNSEAAADFYKIGITKKIQTCIFIKKKLPHRWFSVTWEIFKNTIL